MSVKELEEATHFEGELPDSVQMYLKIGKTSFRLEEERELAKLLEKVIRKLVKNLSSQLATGCFHRQALRESFVFHTRFGPGGISAWLVRHHSLSPRLQVFNTLPGGSPGHHPRAGRSKPHYPYSRAMVEVISKYTQAKRRLLQERPRAAR